MTTLYPGPVPPRVSIYTKDRVREGGGERIDLLNLLNGAGTQLGHPREEREPRTLAQVRLVLRRLGDTEVCLQALLWRLPQQEL